MSNLSDLSLPPAPSLSGSPSSTHITTQREKNTTTKLRSKVLNHASFNSLRFHYKSRLIHFISCYSRRTSHSKLICSHLPKLFLYPAAFTRSHFEVIQSLNFYGINLKFLDLSKLATINY